MIKNDVGAAVLHARKHGRMVATHNPVDFEGERLGFTVPIVLTDLGDQFVAFDGAGHVYEAYTSEFIIEGRLLYSRTDKQQVEREGHIARQRQDESFLLNHPDLQQFRSPPKVTGATLVGGIPASSAPWTLAIARIDGKEVVIACCAEHPPYLIRDGKAEPLCNQNSPIEPLFPGYPAEVWRKMAQAK